MKQPNKPVVLILAGNDPSGGAGICADIEAIASHGCHAAPVIACMTVQDSVDVDSVHPVEPQLLLRQAEKVLADLPVAAIKIGLLGARELARAAGEILQACLGVPVVCDPVLASGGGRRELGQDMAAAITEHIIPATTVATPNRDELHRLAPGCADEAAAADQLLKQGCRLVLVTGADSGSDPVINRLYSHDEQVENYAWARLPERYHGSGCTLAASIAALLARGRDARAAIHEAQAYTWQTLAQAERPGRGQHIPHRLYWATQDDDSNA